MYVYAICYIYTWTRREGEEMFDYLYKVPIIPETFSMNYLLWLEFNNSVRQHCYKKAKSIPPKKVTLAQVFSCEFCKISKNTASFCCRSGVFIVNFEYISHFAIVFLLLTLSW